MVLIVFFAALFYAITVIGKFWWFFSWFFGGIVVALAFWIVLMLFNIAWRYNAKTQMILDDKNIPLQLSEKRTPAPIYYPENHPDYNAYFAEEEDE